MPSNGIFFEVRYVRQMVYLERCISRNHTPQGAVSPEMVYTSVRWLAIKLCTVECCIARTGGHLRLCIYRIIYTSKFCMSRNDKLSAARHVERWCTCRGAVCRKLLYAHGLCTFKHCKRFTALYSRCRVSMPPSFKCMFWLVFMFQLQCFYTSSSFGCGVSRFSPPSASVPDPAPFGAGCRIGGWGCESNREIIDMCVRVGARGDVLSVAGSRGANISYCCGCCAPLLVFPRGVTYRLSLFFVTFRTKYWYFRNHDFQWFHKCNFRPSGNRYFLERRLANSVSAFEICTFCSITISAPLDTDPKDFPPLKF